MSIKSILIIFTASLFLVGCSGDIVNKKNAVVLVIAEKLENPMIVPSENAKVGSGSGFFIDENVIITNNHVVENSKAIVIKTEEGKEFFPVEIVFADALIDIAVLKIKDWEKFKETNKVSYLTLSQINVKHLDTVYTIGHPWGLHWSISRGIVSHPLRHPFSNPKSYIQTDAKIFEGNSGGPLVNEHGYVVGVNTVMIVNNGGSYGFATPSPLVIKLLNDFKKYGEARWAVLGVVMDDSGLIKNIGPDSAAEAVGLKADDRIVSYTINDVRHMFDNFDNFIYNLSLADYSEKVTIQVERSKKPLTFELQPKYKVSTEFTENK